jgi:predicted Zn finger-like uncharacterized protein
MKIVVRVLLIAAICFGIYSCFRSLGGGNLTARENGLFSILLTGLSILASWLVSDMYSANQYREALEEVQEAHRTNLRTYALKAAEKVTNLSNELARLSTYLQQELDYTDYRSVDEELLAKEERLESSIHLINTLKSVNDTSLSDWQGVIGDELEEQREEKNERERDLRESLSNMEHILMVQSEELAHRQKPDDALRLELDSLRRDLRLMMSAAGGIAVPLHRTSKTRHVVEAECPKCQAPLKYKQSSVGAKIKAVRCASCTTKFVARFDSQKGHYLTLRAPVLEKFVCPSCHVPGALDLDPLPGAIGTGHCSDCGRGITLVRAADGVRTRLTVERLTHSGITNELVEAIRLSLPEQPWPSGVHRQVADKLQLTSTMVSKVIQKLIKDGVFLDQHDGIVVGGVRPASSPPPQE